MKQLQAKGELKQSLKLLKGKGTARAIMLLSKQVNKEELVALMEEALDGANAYTVISVFEILEKLQFDESGFTAVLKRVCPLKTGLAHNWRAIVAISKRISKQRNFTTSASTVCR